MLQRAERMKINGSKLHDQIFFLATWKIASFQLHKGSQHKLKAVAFTANATTLDNANQSMLDDWRENSTASILTHRMTTKNSGI